MTTSNVGPVAVASPPTVRSDAVVDPRIGNLGPALLALEDGTIFPGVAFGAPTAAGGDLVVNTSQTGYQEIATDPSYAGQIVVMTYPLIGNYGRLADDDQSLRPWLRGLVVANATAAVLDDARQLAAHLRGNGIPAIAGVDTRALARHLRTHGSLRAMILEPGALDRRTAVERAGAVPRWEDQDFVAQVSPMQPYEIGDATEDGPLVAIVDFGLKSNIITSLRRRGARVRVLPHTATAEAVLRDDVAGVVLSPGPGDPARLTGPVALTREIIADGRPLLGICLGHQIIGLAAGAETRRLRFGHHGANHPVRDLDTGYVQVTAQNHEVQVVGDTLPAGSGFRVSQVNLNDGSVEGLRHERLPIETVQYHPEGAPGPLDALAVFERFVAGCRGTGAAPRRLAVPGFGEPVRVEPAGRPGSVLIIGSGPVVIGQAAEFDYAGTQACRALRAEGIRTILVNSNPATIMTDPEVADAVYLEPLTVPAIEAVIARERPDGLLAGLGGQTGLNLATQLAEADVLARYDVKLLGTPLEAIRMAEDRERFRDLLDRIGQPYAPSAIVEGDTPAARQASSGEALAEIGLPAIIRPAFTLGGTGGGIVETEAQYHERVRAGLRASPIGQVMVERCLVGWQEVEYEVMRDADDTCIAVCSMENVDPLGVHTGDSIVVAPVQTLTDAVHQRLRSAALAIIRALGVEGGCNVQFALSPDSSEYAVIEVNPRVSRSSALASKATGYPIARVAAQIAAGRRLAEIPNVVTGTTVAAFEPALDYVVVKLPRFPFDKFPTADRTLGSQMKATGEVMAIDRTFGAALNKALRGLEQAGSGPLAEDPAWRWTVDYLGAVLGRAGDGEAPDATEPIRWIDERGQTCESTRLAERSAAPIVLRRFLAPSDDRLWRILALLRRGVSEASIHETTGIAPWFVAELGRNVRLERDVRNSGATLADPDDEAAATLLATAKRAGFGDRELGLLAGVDADEIRAARRALDLAPGYAMVDTCAAEFAAETPYFYATYAAAGSQAEAPPVERPGALVIGSGPVRIGQGIEFDYCAVKAAESLRRLESSAVLVNSNPETVSTDFDASTRLYFEPLDRESVESVIEAESPEPEATLPAMVAFGGQTPLNLAAPLAASGVPLLGSDLEAIDQAEERTRFANLLDQLGIPQPEGGMARSVEEALTLADRIGYPVIVRPSFVIGGLAIDFAYSPEDLVRQLAAATVVDPDRPVRIDRYLEGIEVDVDAVSDGDRVLIPGLLEHVERAGVHSGDSVAMFPPQSVGQADQGLIVESMRRVVRALGATGLVNAQFIVRDDGVYLIEVNPRASRTVPFMSKVTGVPMVDLAVRIALGATLEGLGWPDGLLPTPNLVAVKAPAFSTAKLRGVDPSVGPFMQSTGEVIGIHEDPRVALAKALQGAALVPPRAAAEAGDGAPLALLSIADRDKARLPRLGRALQTAGYRLAATAGTRQALAEVGIDAVLVARLADDADTPDVLSRIRSGDVRLVVNTPTPRSGAIRDAAEIRHAAIEEGVLCLTAIETAVAAAEALDPALEARIAEVRPLAEWLAPERRAPGGAAAPDSARETAGAMSGS